MHVQTVHAGHVLDYHITLPELCVHICLECFLSVTFNLSPVKPPSHPAIKTNAHQSHTSTVMLYEIFLYRQLFLHRTSALRVISPSNILFHVLCSQSVGNSKLCLCKPFYFYFPSVRSFGTIVGILSSYAQR